jgi:hypothetical protein
MLLDHEVIMEEAGKRDQLEYDIDNNDSNESKEESKEESNKESKEESGKESK